MAPLSDSGRRSAWRLAALFALVAAGGTLLAGSIAIAVARAALERAAQGAVERRLAAVDAELQRSGSEVGQLLDGLVELLRADAPRLKALERGGPAAVGEAASLAVGHDLDLLTVLDARGQVVSSHDWPQLAGLPAPWLAGLPESVPTLRRIEGPHGTTVALLVRRAVASAEGGLTLVGGRSIDARFAQRIDPLRPPWLVDLDADGVAAAGESEERAASRAGGRRMLRDDRDRALVAAVVAEPIVDPWPVGTARTLAVAALLAAAVGAAAGAWLATRLARPVERLVRAVDAIAAGREDHTFVAPADHDLERLAGAFSRLQRSLERQQLRSAAAERVAAWREVARHVAHEVKNPLVPIRLTVENLVRARERGAELFDGLFADGARTILEEVDQLSRLVGEFSEFARLPAPQPRSLEPHALLEGVLELHAAEPGLEVERAYGRRPVAIEADPDQLARALKNLVGNAVEAMREVEVAPRLVVCTRIAGGMFEIEIADNGPGLPAAATERMFEPYVTTKAQGSGLGMAIARRIVVEHGGELELENRPGGGACARLRLPLGPAPVAEEAGA